MERKPQKIKVNIKSVNGAQGSGGKSWPAKVKSQKPTSQLDMARVQKIQRQAPKKTFSREAGKANRAELSHVAEHPLHPAKGVATAELKRRAKAEHRGVGKAAQLGHDKPQHALQRGKKGGTFYLNEGRKVYVKK